MTFFLQLIYMIKAKGHTEVPLWEPFLSILARLYDLHEDLLLYVNLKKRFLCNGLRKHNTNGFSKVSDTNVVIKEDVVRETEVNGLRLTMQFYLVKPKYERKEKKKRILLIMAFTSASTVVDVAIISSLISNSTKQVEINVTKDLLTHIIVQR
ncbi:hypothetical protein EDC96DRAFT_540187 [Choanephora cucurbitarum]|nr:hypothetical protein EDC96DRAFT_540187 [Choanephora cucurbitarum]